jgi:hypothetical protein
LRLKTDSYALETNVHFPTGLNLLWDSTCKCFDTVKKYQAVENIEGWRKIKICVKALKASYVLPHNNYLKARVSNKKITTNRQKKVKKST